MSLVSVTGVVSGNDTFIRPCEWACVRDLVLMDIKETRRRISRHLRISINNGLVTCVPDKLVFHLKPGWSGKDVVVRSGHFRTLGPFGIRRKSLTRDW